MANPIGSLLDGILIDKVRFEAERDRLVRAVLQAQTDTVRDVTRGLEKDLEQATRAAVKGRLWRAWKSESYPLDRGPAIEPAGEIWVNGRARSQGAMQFFTRAGRIRGRNGEGVAIPLPAAGARGRDRNLTPAEFEKRTGTKLRPVRRRDGTILLVLDEAVLSGKRQIGVLNTARRRKLGRGDVTVPIFIIMPFVAFANRFSIEPIIARAAASLPREFQVRAGKIR